MFTVGFVSGSHDFMLYFTSGGLHMRLLIKKILIHSADVGWDGYVRACSWKPFWAYLTHKASNYHGCEAHCNVI